MNADQREEEPPWTAAEVNEDGAAGADTTSATRALRLPLELNSIGLPDGSPYFKPLFLPEV